MTAATPPAIPRDPPPEPMAEQTRVVGATLVGFAVQAVLALVAVGLYVTGRLQALMLVPFVLAGLLPWAAAVAAALLRKARATEAFELEAARRGGEAARSIFRSELDARPMARRLGRFLRVGVPVTAGLLGLVLAYYGVTGLRQVLGLELGRVPLAGADLLAGITAAAAFVGFVAGTYLLGLGGQLRRPVLRGAAVYLLGTVLLFAAVAAASAAEAAVGLRVVTVVVYYLLPAVTFVVGVEVLLNLVLELYRPSASGETADDARPAFNPRVVEFVVSPGGVVRQLNEAFRYQFGFEVTQSWFVGVLRRSAGSLVLLGAVVLIALSSLVVVGPHERGLVTTFGRLADETLGPGLHVKWPWPVSTAEIATTGRVRTLAVGTHTDLRDHPSFLWTNQHTGDADLLVVRSSGPGGDDDGPAVALAAADLLVQWRIDAGRVREFRSGFVDPVRRLRVLSERALSRELALYDIDAAIGSSRTDIADAIEARLREDVAREPLGIEIVKVGLKSVRPPAAVAESFNATVAAEQERVTRRQRGVAERDQTLARVAGSSRRGEVLAQRIGGLARSGDDAARETAEVTALLREGGGSASVVLLAARGERWQSENAARARTARARALSESFAAAGEFLGRRLYLDAVRSALAGRPKDIYLTPAPLHLEFEAATGVGIAGAAGLRIGQND